MPVDRSIPSRELDAEALERQADELPGCTECGWNDEHSPQCSRYGQWAPPSRASLTRQQRTMAVVEAAREVAEAFTVEVGGDEIVAARREGATMQGWVEMAARDLQRLSDALADLDDGGKGESGD